MALGDYGCGVGPCGFDPVVETVARAFARAPTAQEFDGATRDFPLEADGNFRALHPVDQGVALSMCIRKRSIPSAPDVGNTIHEITDLASSRLEAQIQSRVDSAFPLSTFLADGSVSILRLDWERRERGGISVALTYRNNITGVTTPAQRYDYG